MKNICFWLLSVGLSVGLLLGLSVTASAQAAPTVVLLVRHAEKATNDPADPTLTEAGTQRALDLANIAVTASVSAIYSTQFKRTKATAQPLADKLKLPVTVTEISRETAKAHPATLAKEILAKHAGRTVLVVGHSNTVPAITEALSGVKIDEFDEAREFDRLVIVIIPPQGKAQVMQERYGKRN